MALASFRSEVAEDALREVNRLLAGFVDSSRPEIGARRRLPSFLPGARDRGASATLVGIVAVAEHFSGALLTREAAPNADGMATLIRATSSWEALAKTWKTDPHGIDFSMSQGRYARLSAFVTARNAVAHGLGDLTLRQRQNPEARSLAIKQLATVDLLVEGDSVVVDEAAVRSCAEVARDFIVWLDASAVQARGSQAQDALLATKAGFEAEIDGGVGADLPAFATD